MIFRILAWVAVGIIVTLLIYLAYLRSSYSMPLRRDRSSPHTFYCKRCGQRFDAVDGGTRLQAIGSIENSNCVCVRRYKDIIIPCTEAIGPPGITGPTEEQGN